ncbi:conserved hypothetical protein [Burkholderia sp. 8Y]|uniref:hypothetical protein n=1 Tax=Burkholderia sp. 8Y TaxID=2653133 RepID=UPI0012F472C3|nr:hypothetical protein [Burkholderia sp. 8Y]VXB36182.1 conserved hypothetical protein [Burkholderia sp. 8Y]
MKRTLWAGYLIIGLMVAVYESFWGATHYKSFAYNPGRGLVWPVVMIPSLGEVIGAIILLAVILGILVFGKGKD